MIAVMKADKDKSLHVVLARALQISLAPHHTGGKKWAQEKDTLTKAITFHVLGKRQEQYQKLSKEVSTKPPLLLWSHLIMLDCIFFSTQGIHLQPGWLTTVTIRHIS